MAKYKCPRHELLLKIVPDYNGAMVCPAGAKYCPDIFIVIDGHLCVDRDIKGIGGAGPWWDIKSGEIRTPEHKENWWDVKEKEK